MQNFSFSLFISLFISFQGINKRHSQLYTVYTYITNTTIVAIVIVVNVEYRIADDIRAITSFVFIIEVKFDIWNSPSSLSIVFLKFHLDRSPLATTAVSYLIFESGLGIFM